MAALKWQTFHSGLNTAVAAGNWATDNHYAILVTAGYIFDQTDVTLADLSAYEIVDAGYLPKNLLNETLTDVGSGVIMYDCDDIAFGDPLTIAAAGCIILMGTVGAKSGADAVVAYSQLAGVLGTPELVSVANSEFTVKIAVTGVGRLTQQ